ncbi:SAVED domain-containing protein [Arcobacter vandammei]|uniref:SAVED domain-containing protein n=1 Tax=Arcobacter vandammei TaxID=2782243 RepID=UPI0018DFA151|nr:SAVED domain-containing protein [Arcobacter vandammei]
MRYILDNKLIAIIGIIAFLLGPAYDYFDNKFFTGTVSLFLCISVLGAVYFEWRKDKKFNKSVVHIPIVIKVDDGSQTQYIMNELLRNIEKQYGYKDYKKILQKYYSVNTDRLIFEEVCDMDNFDRLMNFARVIKYNIAQLEEVLNKPVKIHIAFYRRPAVAFLIGTIFKTNSVAIYQTNNKNSLDMVANIDDRRYKERIGEFKKYIVEKDIKDSNIDEILVVINSASHNVNLNSDDLKNYKNIVKIKLKEPGTIPYENDWTEYSQEIYNVFNSLQTQYKNITIAHSMPEALAILLGMGFGDYWNITITQYNKGSYPKVYKMNEIKYYF